MEVALTEFRREMIKIVPSTDEEISRKKIVIRPSAEVFSEFDEISDILSENEWVATPIREVDSNIEGRQNQESQRPEPLTAESLQGFSALYPQDLKTEREKLAMKDDKRPSSVTKSTRREQSPEAPVKKNYHAQHVRGPLTGVGDRDPSATMPDPIIPPDSRSISITPPPRGGYEDDEDR